jgi:hypothetical protein
MSNPQPATDPVIIKTIDEHPRVMGLVAEIERLRKELFDLGVARDDRIRKDEQRFTAEKMALQAENLELRKQIVGLQDRLLAIVRASLQ